MRCALHSDVMFGNKVNALIFESLCFVRESTEQAFLSEKGFMSQSVVIFKPWKPSGNYMYHLLKN
jgi:hypothetical protein